MPLLFLEGAADLALVISSVIKTRRHLGRRCVQSWQAPVVVAGAAGVPKTYAQALIHALQAPDASGQAQAPAGGAHAPLDHPGSPSPAGVPAGFKISLVEARGCAQALRASPEMSHSSGIPC